LSCGAGNLDSSAAAGQGHPVGAKKKKTHYAL